MIQYININNQIRTLLARKLESFYQETNDKVEALALYHLWIRELQSENNSLYKIIINLGFSDAYRILSFLDLYNQLPREREELLYRLKQFHSFEEIEELLEEEPEYFNMLIQSPLKFQIYTLRNQASMLLMGENVIQYFDTFHEIENKAVFQPLILQDIRNMYDKCSLKNKNITTLCFEKLMVLSIGNTKEFYKIIARLIDEFYHISKKLQQHFTCIDDVCEYVISEIEIGSKEKLVYEISYDEELLQDVLALYLSTISIYENTCEEEIKRKQKKI